MLRSSVVPILPSCWDHPAFSFPVCQVFQNELSWVVFLRSGPWWTCQKRTFEPIGWKWLVIMTISSATWALASIGVETRSWTWLQSLQPASTLLNGSTVSMIPPSTWILDNLTLRWVTTKMSTCPASGKWAKLASLSTGTVSLLRFHCFTFHCFTTSLLFISLLHSFRFLLIRFQVFCTRIALAPAASKLFPPETWPKV